MSEMRYAGAAASWGICLLLSTMLPCRLCSGHTAWSQVGAGKISYASERVEVQIEVAASIYTYEVTNRSDTPIDYFEIHYYNAYSFESPENWQQDTENRVFRTWAVEGEDTIEKGETEIFSVRVTSGGAALGTSQMKLGFTDGESAVISGAWVPVTEPQPYAMIVAGTMLAAVLFHCAMVVKGKRQRAGTGFTCDVSGRQ